MQKAAKHFSAITCRILFIGFTMQIALGLVWMCCNIGRLEEPGWPVQLVLLSVAFGAGLFLVRTITKTKKIMWMVWGSLALLTVPMSLQCHLMNPKESVIGSFLVCQISFLWKVLGSKEPASLRGLATVATGWVLLAAVAPEYVLLGAVPVVLLFLYGLFGGTESQPVADKRRKTGYRVLLFLAFGGMIFGIYNLKPENTENAENTGIVYEVSADLFGRCTWTTIIRDWNYWTDEMHVAIGSEDVWVSASHYADNMNELLKPTILQNLGEEGAIDFYRSMTAEAFTKFPAQILKECLWDAFAYSVPPVGSYWFLEGRGYDSYCPVNYELMRRQAPRLTGYYLNYSCQWFGVAMVLVALNAVLAGISKPKAGVAVIITCAAIVLYYTLQGAGIMDYRKTIVICSLWVTWMISTMIKQPEENG